MTSAAANRRPPELIANRTINLAIRANEIPGGWEAQISIWQAHALIVRALEFERNDQP